MKVSKIPTVRIGWCHTEGGIGIHWNRAAGIFFYIELDLIVFYIGLDWE